MDKKGKGSGSKMSLSRSSTTSIAKLSSRRYKNLKRMSEDEDEVGDKIPRNLDEIISPNVSTQSTESLPSPPPTLLTSNQSGTDSDEQDLIILTDDEDDGGGYNGNSSSSVDAAAVETVDQDPSTGLMKIPEHVVKMIKNSRSPPSTYGEILLDGCVPPLLLIPCPDEYNGLRYRYKMTADDVVRKIYRKNNPKDANNNNENKDY